MLITFKRPITSKYVLQIVLTGLLTVGLVLFLAGCDAAGTDGDDPGIEAPAAPSGLEGTSGNSEIGLEWEEVGGADEYNVYRDTESGVDVSGDPVEKGTVDLSYTDTEVENGKRYFYVVTAVNTGDEEEAESDASSEVEKTPFDEPPSRPGN